MAGASVVDVAGGLEVLEPLGADLALAPAVWAPDVLVTDARLPRLDGVDALAEVRAPGARRGAVLVLAPDGDIARARAPARRATLVERAAPPAALAPAAVRLRPPTRRVARPAPTT